MRGLTEAEYEVMVLSCQTIDLDQAEEPMPIEQMGIGMQLEARGLLRTITAENDDWIADFYEVTELGLEAMRIHESLRVVGPGRSSP